MHKQNRSHLSPLSFLICILIFSLTSVVNAEPTHWVYTVTEDDNLWDLTLKYSHIRYWRKIQSLNNINHPRQIPPGTTIKIPLIWLNLQSAKVEVIDIKGEPSFTNENNQPLPVKVGSLLEKGSTLVTEKEENALLEFVDDSQMLIKENTQIVLEQLLTYNKTGIADTRITLNKGRTENFVKQNKTSAGTHYQLTTPSAVMAVRGTEYRVSVSQDQQVSRSEVLKGSVDAAGSGTTQKIPAYNGTIIKQGEPPSPPVQLLSAPDLSSMEKIIRSVPISLAFNALQDAEAYRIEISTDDKFSSLLFDGTSKLPIFRGTSLADGHYWVRIRGIDHLGLEGVNAKHQFELDARPFSPFIVMPSEGAVVREETLLFKWTQAKNITSYHFQLATTSDFSKLLIDEPDMDDFKVSLDNIEPGEYYWHVASINEQQEQGPFSDTVKFNLKPSPVSPELESPEINEEQLILRWKKGNPGQSYHFQLAEDEEFTEIIEDQQLDNPSITMPILSSGTYYIRVATLDSDGYHGEFGNTQMIDIPASDYWYLLLLLLLTPLLILL